MKTVTNLILCFTMLVASGCGGNSQKSDKKAEKNQATVVKVERAQMSTYSPVLTFSGTVKANREANLGSAIPGRIERIYAPEGKRVRKGELLVDLSDELLTQVAAEYDAVKKDLKRVERLTAKEVLSQQKLDHVKARYDACEAKFSMIRKNTQIRAPFTGTVVEHLMEEGENYSYFPSLKPGYSHSSGVIRLMQLNPVVVEFDVPDRQMSSIHKGMDINFVSDALPDTLFNGKIVEISPILSVTTHSGVVKAKIDNEEHGLMPGMFGTLSLVTEKQTAVFIPESAINRIRGTAQFFVLTIDKNVARRKDVKILSHEGERVSVEGINEGTAVITSGKNRVTDGSRVRVSERG